MKNADHSVTYGGHSEAKQDVHSLLLELKISIPCNAWQMTLMDLDAIHGFGVK